MKGINALGWPKAPQPPRITTYTDSVEEQMIKEELLDKEAFIEDTKIIMDLLAEGKSVDAVISHFTQSLQEEIDSLEPNTVIYTPEELKK